MLPFLKPRQVAGVIIAKRKPDGGTETQGQEGDEMQPLEAACDDIQRALAAKDSKQLAEAIKAAFEICDSMPHEEGPHTNDEPSEQENE